MLPHPPPSSSKPLSYKLVAVAAVLAVSAAIVTAISLASSSTSSAATPPGVNPPDVDKSNVSDVGNANALRDVSHVLSKQRRSAAASLTAKVTFATSAALPPPAATETEPVREDWAFGPEGGSPDQSDDA
ncbi:hypothetical protein RHMOL_Rhmol05G0108700 [Rhododendron molle]|uniref:Uncharacterized protein n=1 Tax=Rhododendron molle TaxID=49168 RepID=A0ACC0NMQ3_RHOML|nr:hypothetical protein RHMOL_Rhmol05G0108700 [Rhododendron molle]